MPVKFKEAPRKAPKPLRTVLKKVEVEKARHARKAPAPDRVAFREAEVVAALCRRSFYQFVKEFWHTVVPERPDWNWHLKVLCDEMQALAERVFRGEAKAYDLVVNISPGTTKSTIMSVMFTAWVWTRMPSARVIGASYAFPLAMDLSRKCRDVITSEKYRECFPGVVLRDDQNTKGYFANTAGGYRYAVGVNGSVLGMHGHFIVVDDPLDPNEALSVADLATANHWIKETLSSRKVDKVVTPTVLVMQRLHHDDPTALFLARKKVRHVCLPAEIDRADPDDVAHVKPAELVHHYSPDGLMDPKRLSRQALADAKENGEAYYAAQFLQRPVPKGGLMFDCRRLRYGAPPPLKEFEKLVRYWDKAGTLRGGAFTVGTLIGKHGSGRFWVLDVVREQLDSGARELLILRTAQQDGRNVVVGVEQEPGSGGKESAEATVAMLAGFTVKVDRVDASTGGKVARADPWSVQVNNGNVSLPEPDQAAWVRGWVDEHRHFPNSRYKDQVDSASGGFALVHKRVRRVGALRYRTEEARRRLDELRALAGR